jgi:hypothetical protein
VSQSKPRNLREEQVEHEQIMGIAETQRSNLAKLGEVVERMDRIDAKLAKLPRTKGAT